MHLIVCQPSQVTVWALSSCVDAFTGLPPLFGLANLAAPSERMALSPLALLARGFYSVQGTLVSTPCGDGEGQLVLCWWGGVLGRYAAAACVPADALAQCNWLPWPQSTMGGKAFPGRPVSHVSLTCTFMTRARIRRPQRT